MSNNNARIYTQLFFPNPTHLAIFFSGFIYFNFQVLMTMASFQIAQMNPISFFLCGLLQVFAHPILKFYGSILAHFLATTFGFGLVTPNILLPCKFATFVIATSISIRAYSELFLVVCLVLHVFYFCNDIRLQCLPPF